MKKYALIGALIFAQGGYVASIDGAIFPTLTQVQQYAESLPEHIETETDWLNPDFSLFHKERAPGRMRRLINWFGLGRRAWNSKEFNRLLHSLIKKRELNGLMGDFIQKYQEVPGDRIFIWTDLFGAFHSLVRDLEKLRSKGIIGDDFKIAKPEYLFVFNGNVIDHSPYVLETLTLVMRLLEVNPQQVIYTRGDHEDKQEWHSYGLARELKIRAAGLSREVIPLNKLMTQFFNTLPLGLFLPRVTEKEINVVLIANNEYSKSGFEVKKIAGFLEKEENGKLSSFKLSNKLTAKKSVHIKVIISGEDRSITYHQTAGLTMLGMQREALRWLNFSSPTSRNRRLYEFFNDAFVEIKIQDQLDDWTITLYNQDVRKLFGLKKAATYDLLTGQRIKEGVKKPKKKAPPKEEKKKKEPPKVTESPKDLEKKPEKKPSKKAKKEEEPEPTTLQEAVIGSTLDLSKSASMIGKPVKEGLDTGEGPWIKKEVRPPSDKKPVKEEKKAEAVPDKKEELKELKKKEPKEKDKEAEELTKEEPVVADGEKKPLILGSTLDLTRAVKFQSKSVKVGIDLRLKEEREAGDSVISQVIVVDDEYTPRKTVQEVNRFLEQGIDILLNPLGSPTLEAYLDLVKQGKVLVLFPMTGAPLFRKKDLKYMAHIRPSYIIEGKILTEYALDTLKAKKGVMFYQDDAFGQGFLEGAQELLKKRKITNWLAVPYQRNDVTFAKQVARIKKYDPDVLLFFSVTTAARGLIRQLGIQEVAGKHMLGSSEFGEGEFQRFMKEKGLKMFYLNAVPNPQQSDIAIAKQFRDAANREGVPIDVFSLESYLATDFLIDIVKKIRGAATKEKIINAIAKVKNHNYKGMLFNFDPENRTLSSTLWMYTGSPDWQQIEVTQNKEDAQ
ncbi:hypothetical protein E3J61_00145 [Candidatus Dependentiae bacterium]|nr:MAG: hypothetical protein E3J61_00145 [Candidatus Dependentiae bacterium]